MSSKSNRAPPTFPAGDAMSRRRRRDRDVLIVLLVLLALGVLAAAVTGWP